VAELIGFLGNELVADGLHARTDGFTSLAVLAGAGGLVAGFPLADPLVGLLITVAILVVLRTAVRDVWRRLMDAVDPALVDSAEAVLLATPGVTGVRRVRMRWIGHALQAEADLDIDGQVSVTEAHRLAHDAEHRLVHQVPKPRGAVIHAYPPSDTSPPRTEPRSSVLRPGRARATGRPCRASAQLTCRNHGRTIG
jgi:cation diffusion facilitator family transporter